jgi:hypothetical protein
MGNASGALSTELEPNLFALNLLLTPGARRTRPVVIG